MSVWARNGLQAHNSISACFRESSWQTYQPHGGEDLDFVEDEKTHNEVQAQIYEAQVSKQ